MKISDFKKNPAWDKVVLYCLEVLELEKYTGFEPQSF